MTNTAARDAYHDALDREHDHAHHETHDDAVDRSCQAAKATTHNRTLAPYDRCVDELLDRVALRELVEAYAHNVDRLNPEAVAALFCDDGVLAIYEGDPDVIEPARVRTGHREIADALSGLSRYAVTTHFLGQHSIQLAGDTATGETYCMAHHITDADGERRDKVLSIRYLDRFRRVDAHWRIEERRLAIDWSDERVLPRS
ncbi:MAG: nuclear transport factor 2 family protein [Acidimicrobiia bacterium]|nr:nuclear transport factor 2 family protein [Acidimicrobiia bacterium]